ncbi:Retrovirus-related Pol polyprotein from transposon opus [Vitis vinifera]|uniref:Retrovirus-related Pol polyprotein from transposon opus n=1 Tax=Vitis vinifera TaxID=29760 RepID=A0A438ISV1_VITVI|nr:Retrovirus-related Pol polyprotein from transposon opus [Vitis vinifera]
MPCSICQSYEHFVEECPTIPAVREMFGDQANVIGQLKPNNNVSYGNTYNSNRRNRPNFSWKPRALQYTQPSQASQQASNLEQTIVNLSKGKFPSQPHQNPKGIHEVEAHEGESSQVRDVKAMITLRSAKRGLNVNKKAFLTEQVSAIIQCKSPVKYKDPGCLPISVMIGGTLVEKALLDLAASVNLLPYSVYKQLGLGELKPTSITLSLADRSVKIPREMIEDVLVQVDNFYYPVDFVVLDMDPIVKETNYVPIIPGRPFLATSNAIINWLPEPSDLLATLPGWRMIEEILPLFNEEEIQEVVKEEAPKLILKPLPTELKYAYLEENKKCPIQGIVLGHIISKKSIEVDKAKVELIVKLSSPTTVKECQKSFEQLKQFLTIASIVRVPNWQLPFEVMCDSSDFAIGAVLGQREDGKPYVIYYASKTLNETQRNYTTTEKELLVVIFALDKFRAYLVGSFIVSSNLQVKDKKGVENVVADHLSRLAISHNSHGLPINDDFPEESLMLLEDASWYAQYANYLVTGEVPNQIIRSVSLNKSNRGSSVIATKTHTMFLNELKPILCKHNDHRVVLKFSKRTSSQDLGCLGAIISDEDNPFKLRNNPISCENPPNSKIGSPEVVRLKKNHSVHPEEHKPLHFSHSQDKRSPRRVSISSQSKARASLTRDSIAEAPQASAIPPSKGKVPSNPPQCRYETRRPPTTPGASTSRPKKSVRHPPTKKTRVSGLGVSSAPPQPQPPTIESQIPTEMTPEVIIRRPMVTQPPIEGNLDCQARPFHSELCFDMETFKQQSEFRDSFHLLQRYHLEHLMTLKDFFYP